MKQSEWKTVGTVMGWMAVIGVAGCLPAGGSGGGSQETGSLRVEITDKPFPFEFIESAVITIDHVEVRSADADDDEDDGNDNEAKSENDNEVDDDDEGDDSDGPFITIFEGPASFDLLELQNGRTDLLAESEIAAGTYTQMRIFVTGGVIQLTDGREFELEVPSGDESGIKLNFDFDVVADEETQLLLDVDLSRAFSAIPSGHIDDVSTIDEFRFTPSVAMKLIDLLDAGSISGTVTDAEGAPLADVAVTAYENDEEVNTTSTAADGSYTLGALSAGEYRVEFSASGLADAEVTGVSIVAGETTVGVDAVMTL